MSCATHPLSCAQAGRLSTPCLSYRDTTYCAVIQNWKWAVGHSILSPALFLFVIPIVKPTEKWIITTKASETWKTQKNVFIIQKRLKLQFVFNYKLQKLGFLPIFLQNAYIRPNLAIYSPLRPRMCPIPKYTFST